MRLIFDNDGAFFLALERYGYDIADGARRHPRVRTPLAPARITGEIDGQIGALLFELLIQRDLGRIAEPGTSC
jgi:N-acetylmuramoyl-L-alanine amidase